MPLLKDTVSRRAKEEVGDNAEQEHKKRLQNIAEEGAINMLSHLGAGIANPFAPGTPPMMKIDANLYREAQNTNRALMDLTYNLGISRIQKAAREKVGEFNNYAAHKGTIPHTVANLYLGRIREQEVDAINAIGLETAQKKFISSVNELQSNYSMQNKCASALYQINEQANAWKRDLFNDVFQTGVKYLFT